MSIRRRLFVACAALSLVVGSLITPTAAAGASQPTHYRITDVGTLGGSFSAPLGVSNRGVVVGLSSLPGDAVFHGYVWKDGTMTDIGTLGGPKSIATSSNSSGVVTAWANTTEPAKPSLFNNTGFLCDAPPEGQAPVVCRAVIWDHGRLTDLGTLGGSNSTVGQINNRGQVVGTAETTKTDPTSPNDTPEFHAVLWNFRTGNRGGSSMTDLGTLNGDPDSLANSINSHGQVVGISIDNVATWNGPNARGWLWQRGRMVALATLGGSYSSPTSINNRGDIVGHSSFPGDQVVDGILREHAVLWKEGRVIDLGTLPGDTDSEAFHINDRGLIVGISCGANGCRAVRWNARQITDLNGTFQPTSDWYLFDGLSANNRGQIVGDGDHLGLPHAYLLTPR